MSPVALWSSLPAFSSSQHRLSFFITFPLAFSFPCTSSLLSLLLISRFPFQAASWYVFSIYFPVPVSYSQRSPPFLFITLPLAVSFPHSSSLLSRRSCIASFPFQSSSRNVSCYSLLSLPPFLLPSVVRHSSTIYITLA